MINRLSKIIVTATCRNCGHKWQPLGNEPISIPYSSKVKCPTCSEWQNEVWMDEETRIRITKRKLGLDIDPEIDQKDMIRKLGLDIRPKIDNKMQALEQQISLLESKLSFESKSRELLEKELKEIRSWMLRHEKTFQIIERTAHEIEEEEKKFSNDNK
jgi:hypothetical protein